MATSITAASLPFSHLSVALNVLFNLDTLLGEKSALISILHNLNPSFAATAKNNFIDSHSIVGESDCGDSFS